MVVLDIVKAHVGRHQKAYTIGVIVLASGVSVFVTRRVTLAQNGGVQIVDAFKLVNWKSPHTSTTVLIPRGDPGNIVRCRETGELFASQNRAAVVNGINKSEMSKVVNGLKDNAKGLHFEKLGKAVA